jgi:hypothetical protein
MATGLNFQT